MIKPMTLYSKVTSTKINQLLQKYNDTDKNSQPVVKEKDKDNYFLNPQLAGRMLQLTGKKKR